MIGSGQPKVFDKPYDNGAEGTSVRQYDVTAGPRRFLMMKTEPVTSGPLTINVILSWFEEVKRLAENK